MTAVHANSCSSCVVGLPPSKQCLQRTSKLGNGVPFSRSRARVAASAFTAFALAWTEQRRTKGARVYPQGMPLAVDGHARM